MLKYIVLLALFGAAVESARSKHATPKRDPQIPDVGYFDCTGVVDDIFDHPWDCTRFIKCDNGRAHDFSCAQCNRVDNPAECRGSDWNHFDKSINKTACIYPVDSTCQGGSEPTTESDEVTDSITTERSTVSTTEPTTTTEVIGTKCNATDCSVKGDCRRYWFCNRTSSNPNDDDGVWVYVACPLGNFFNRAESARLEVGVCSEWDDLSQADRDDYLTGDLDTPGEKTCTYCVVEPIPATGDCTSTYKYRDNNGNSETRSCGAGLVFSKRTRSCVDTC